jgi:DNA-binding transcriptional LysR family regulator
VRAAPVLAALTEALHVRGVDLVVRGLDSSAPWQDQDAERVRTYDVVPVPVPDVADADGQIVVDDWRLDDLGLRGLDATVSTSQRVVAVPLGENAWPATVERFLLTRSGEELGACAPSRGSPVPRYGCARRAT